MFGFGGGKRRKSQDSSSNETQADPGRGEAMKVPDLLARRRSSIHPSAANFGAASSSIAAPDVGPNPSTPSSAPPLTLRRGSLAVPPPQQDTYLNTAPISQARRSSVALGAIGSEGSGGALTGRRASALGSSLLGAARDAILPSRALTSHSSLRIDPPPSSKYQSSRRDSHRDPLMKLDKNDIRRPSFAETLAATGESLVKGRPRTRHLRRTLLRLALIVAFAYLAVKIFTSFFLQSSLEEDEDLYPHIPLPPSFTSLMQRDPSPSNIPISSEPPRPLKAVLTGEEIRAFRRENLWGPPTDEIKNVVIKPAEEHHHESTVIFLHGLLQYAGDSPLAQHLPGRFPNTRWVMPQGEPRPVTLQDGKVVPAWFDMLAFPYDNALDEDPKNLYRSSRLINAVITKERDDLIRAMRERGGFEALPEAHRPKREEGDEVEEVGEFGTRVEKQWASSRIVLSGFSQGSVMTLLVGLTTKYRLGGLVLISSFMPLRQTMKSLIADLDRASLPVFWGHGDGDEYLTLEDAAHSVQLLRATEPDQSGEGGLGLTQLEYRVYPWMGHTYCGDELNHIEEFIRRSVPQ